MCRPVTHQRQSWPRNTQPRPQTRRADVEDSPAHEKAKREAWGIKVLACIGVALETRRPFSWIARYSVPVRCLRPREIQTRSERYRPQTERVADYGDGTHSHCRAGNHRVQEQPESRIEHPSSNGHRRCVEYELEEQILPDVAHRSSAEPACPDNSPEVALDERNCRAFHRNIGPGAHRYANLGLRQSGCVVDAVTSHRDEPALILESLNPRCFLVGQNPQH